MFQGGTCVHECFIHYDCMSVTHVLLKCTPFFSLLLMSWVRYYMRYQISLLLACQFKYYHEKPHPLSSCSMLLWLCCRLWLTLAFIKPFPLSQASALSNPSSPSSDGNIEGLWQLLAKSTITVFFFSYLIISGYSKSTLHNWYVSGQWSILYVGEMYRVPERRICGIETQANR